MKYHQFRRILRFRWLFTKRIENQRNISNFVTENANLDLSGRQTCVGVRLSDRALLQLACRFEPFRKPSVNVSYNAFLASPGAKHAWA